MTDWLVGPEDIFTNLRVLAEVDNAAEEVEETLEALEGLKEVDERVGGQLLVVLGRNLDTHLGCRELGNSLDQWCGSGFVDPDLYNESRIRIRMERYKSGSGSRTYTVNVQKQAMANN